MSAILLLLVVLLWVLVVAFLAYKLVRRVPVAAGVRVLLWLVLVPLLLLAPMLDEIIGARQFEALCRPENAVQVHFKVTHPRDLREVFRRRDAVPGRFIPISVQQVDYVERRTGAVAASARIYGTEGGWFSRTILQGWGPWFGRGECAPRPGQMRQLATLAGTV